MRRKIFAFVVVLMAAISMPHFADAGCKTGGPGESSCSFVSETTVLNFTLLKVERTVTNCPAGTYACCKLIGSGCK